MKERHTILIFLLILLLTVPLSAHADGSKAVDLTGRCRLDTSETRGNPQKLLENNGSFLTFEAGKSFTLTWTDDVPAARLCLSWQTRPEGVTVTQYDASGTVLMTQTILSAGSTVTPLLPETRKAVVTASDAGMEVMYCRVFGEGVLPEPFHEWLETPDHLDYLLISAHPDDDVLYLGSIVPVYGAERGYVGSIAYVTCSTRKRMTEAENGAWTMGLRYYPLFLGFADVPSVLPEREKDKRFPYDELLKGIVQTYRAYRPVTVFAQDQNGEYGHFQHILTSRAAVEALTLAADASYDPESAERFGTWQVQKVFLHLYPENRITIDATSPLKAFDGLNAVEIAKRAFQKHASQQSGSYTISADTGPLPLNLFGMAAGVVPVGEDVFDNIDPSLLSDYVPQTPEPTDTPVPTDTPAPTDTPEPTAVPVQTDAPASAKVTDTPAPEPDNASKTGLTHIVLAAAIGAIVLCAAGLAAAFLLRKRE